MRSFSGRADCREFSRKGICDKGVTCKFRHDPDWTPHCRPKPSKRRTLDVCAVIRGAPVNSRTRSSRPEGLYCSFVRADEIAERNFDAWDRYRYASNEAYEDMRKYRQELQKFLADCDNAGSKALAKATQALRSAAKFVVDYPTPAKIEAIFRGACFCYAQTLRSQLGARREISAEIQGARREISAEIQEALDLLLGKEDKDLHQLPGRITWS